MYSAWAECRSSVYRFVYCLALLGHSPQHLIPEGKAFYKTLWFRRADSNASCCLAILTQADMRGAHAHVCRYAALYVCTYRTRYWLILVCVFVCDVRPLCHLYFSHHVVIWLHVYSEGLSHLSLAIIQDLNLHKVLLLTLLEFNI